jgi:chromosome segregation ATPase
MNEKLVIKTAHSLNKEKYVLEKLNKQIDNLKEKEDQLRREIAMTAEHLHSSKLKEQEVKEANIRVKMAAEEEITKNKKDHNELNILREMKLKMQKELTRAIQDNLNSKYALEAVREKKFGLENNLRNLQDTFSQLNNEKESLNNELIQYKQEYDELMQIYELKRSEDVQLKSLYKFHFK